MRLADVFIPGALLGVFLSTSDADACQCVVPWADLVWPEPGAIDVPPDAPIVVNRDVFPDPYDAIGYALTRVSSGEPIELGVVRTMVVTSNICFGQVVFLQPTTLLEPGARYAVSFTFNGQPLVGQVTPGSELEFEVGSSSFALEPIGARVSYVRAFSQGTACPEACLDSAEVLLTSDPLTVPYFVSLEGAGLEPESVSAVMLRPGENRWTFSVGAWPNEPCVAFELLNVRGEAIEKSTLCDPTKCSPLTVQTGDSCGGRYGAGFEFWNAVAEGSCEPSVPPLVPPPAPPRTDAGEAADAAPPVEQEGDGAPPDFLTEDNRANRVSPDHGGCRCTLGSRPGAGLRHVAMFLAVLLAGARRRRAAAPPDCR